MAVGSPRKQEVALTFDNGPGPDTLKVLAVSKGERASHLPRDREEVTEHTSLTAAL